MPVTITPKRMKKEVVDNTGDREDNQEDGERGGGDSESDGVKNCATPNQRTKNT